MNVDSKPDPDDWCSPLASQAPAGPWLEYDTAYAALGARMMPAVEVQYGDFTQRREAAPWSDLERECRALLRRSRDITLLVWWLRCRVHACGAAGLQQGLGMLLAVLRSLGTHVHPQSRVDGEFDPALRANALAALTDPETLLAEVRDLVACGSGGELRRVRDVERAEVADEATREDLRMRLHRAHREHDAHCIALREAHRALDGLVAWARDDLGVHAPDLGALQRLLDPFAAPAQGDSAQREPAVCSPEPERAEHTLAAIGGSAHTVAAPKERDEPPASDLATEMPDSPLDGRASAQASIARAREWFEAHEPSSPVSVLLRQAERLVGKRYAEVVQAIPTELLERWERS